MKDWRRNFYSDIRFRLLLALLGAWALWQACGGCRLGDDPAKNAYALVQGLTSPYCYEICLPFWFLSLGHFFQRLHSEYVLLRFPSARRWWDGVRGEILRLALLLSFYWKALSALELLLHARRIRVDLPFWLCFVGDALLLFLGLAVYGFLLFLGELLRKPALGFALCFLSIGYDFITFILGGNASLIMARMGLTSWGAPPPAGVFVTNALILAAFLLLLQALIGMLAERGDALPRKEV